MKELAYTYTSEKVNQALAKIHVDGDSDLTLQAAQELAAAVDIGMISSNSEGVFDMYKPASSEFASMLLGNILSFKGTYKNYLGNSDPDIFQKVNQAWLSQDIQDEQLQTVVDNALKQNLITGYNLKDSHYDPHFDQNLTITYGHNNIVHALQLIGLLHSEGIDAKVQLEPKTSAFIYLKEWGPQDYKIVEDKTTGKSIAYVKEYDISFEFQNVEQKNKFNPIISNFAKKESENQTGLIADSWWQPLYSSKTQMMNYKIISNTMITSEHFYAQIFSLPDKTADIVSGLKKINPDIKEQTYQFWVDEPFYRYLLGDYK